MHEVLQAHLEAIRTGIAPLNYEIASWQDLEPALQKHFRIEVTENDELIRQDLSLIIEVVKNKLAAFLVQEKARGALLPGANPEVLADFCVATVQGAIVVLGNWLTADLAPIRAEADPRLRW